MDCATLTAELGRVKLKPSATVVTRVDGTRTLERGGVHVSLSPAVVTPSTGPKKFGSAALADLVSDHPSLKTAVRMLGLGVPTGAVLSHARANSGASEAALHQLATALQAQEQRAHAKVVVDFASDAQAHGLLGLCSPSLPLHGEQTRLWQRPKRVTTCAFLGRPGYQSLPAHEYLDDEATLASKITVLAWLCRTARNGVAYTGAGMSTAAGVRDYASQVGGMSVRSATATMGPTLAHRALAAMAQQGQGIQHYVDQNHDGLARRAGVPDAMFLAIHGEKDDPDNPVIPMSGQLRPDLLARLDKLRNRADLVLALGTSLCGMRADLLVADVAKRSLIKPGANPQGKANGPSLGSVIVSLQRTPHDATCSLRIFAKLDTVFERLLTHLQLPQPVQPYSPPPRFVTTSPNEAKGDDWSD